MHNYSVKSKVILYTTTLISQFEILANPLNMLKEHLLMLNPQNLIQK